MTLTDFGLLYL